MSYPILAPSSTWYTQGGTTVARGSITQIDIKNSYTPIGTVTSSWDASAAKDSSIMAYVEGTKLTISGNGSGKIAANADSSNIFNGFGKLQTVTGGTLLDTSNATTFERMFQACFDLTTVDVSEWDTSHVGSFKAMFQGATSIGNLDVSGWETSAATDMDSMFNMPGSYINTNLTSLDVSKWDTSSVGNMRAMFSDCKGLTSLDVSSWDTSSCESMYGMFYRCENMQTPDVSKWNTGKVKTMANMFYDCHNLTSLAVSSWDTSLCEDMNYMFYGCNGLVTLDVSRWNVGNVKSMRSMFSCGDDYGTNQMSYTALDVSNWNTSSVTDMSFMFYGCDAPNDGNPDTIDIDISKWDVSNVTTFDHMFAHSYLTIGDTSKWDTSSATNMNAMFYSVQNKTLNVSSFNTSKVLSFGQMFESSAIEKIIGLENFDTTSALDFTQMFNNCTQLKEVNLSSFNTSKATVGADFGSGNGSTTGGTQQMFNNTPRLEKVTLGKNFSFDANGTITDSNYIGVLPTPNSTYIPRANGKWYRLPNYDEFAPADVHSGATQAYTYVVVSLPVLLASSTWYKSAQARSTITQINIVDSYTSTGNEDESWNADIRDNGSIKCYRTGTTLTIAGNGSGKIAANTNSSYAFSDSSRTNFYSNLTVINGLNILDTSNIVNAEGMFSFFESLNTLDVGNFNTSNITNMTAMFARSPSLENLDVATKIINAGTEDEYIAWDVSNVSSFKAMFQGSSSTKKMKIKSLNVEDWNTSSATNMAHMFYRCGELTSIPLDNWNVSNVTTMSHMFSDCSKLQSINLINWDTSKVTTFDAMFNDCIGLTIIDVSRLKTQACLSFAQMFERCSNLTKLVGLDRWDTAKGTKFDQMFEDCSSLTEIIGLNKWNTSSATDVHKMFKGCKSLTAIDVSSFIINNPSAVSQMFEGCENVKHLDLSGFKTLGTTYLAYMFTGMNRLEKITLGADFRFDGCDSSIISSAELPTPDPAYITGADGKWYTFTLDSYTPAEVPNLTANTYYGSLSLVRNTEVLLKNGTIIDIAAQIKQRTGKTDKIRPSAMANEIAKIEKLPIAEEVEY